MPQVNLETVRTLSARLPPKVQEALRLLSYGVYGAPPLRQYAREVMNRDVSSWLSGLDVGSLDAVEVSGTLRCGYQWRTYTSLKYPDFDLTRDNAPDKYDVVICEQVLEHVPDPDAAVHTLRSLARPGGRLVVSTPFLVRIHGSPHDYWRFTPLGLQTLLQRHGFTVVTIQSWGNHAAVTSNLRRWSFYWRWRPLRNNPTLPVVVWAVAEAPL